MRETFQTIKLFKYWNSLMRWSGACHWSIHPRVSSHFLIFRASSQILWKILIVLSYFGVHGLSVSTWLPALSKAYKGTRSIVLKQRQSTQRYPVIWTGRRFCFSIKRSPLPAWIFQTRLKGAFLGIPANWWTLGCQPQSLLPGLQRVLTSILCLRFLTIFQFSHILG